jgi:hypothetical protein
LAPWTTVSIASVFGPTALSTRASSTLDLP